ncbi:DUF1656 domain-containing protein [Aeromonas fluvialis]|uniref:DUF1656 domain-containing protein n=1 Tax=Aeromonas fluvialis TaxID=591962 RepID=UPI0012EE7B82|nr:DUF1656 domain-containing protein [Aeromonas fluvialis]
MIPHELVLADIFFPPLLAAAFLGVMLSVLIAQLLNRLRLNRFFAHPQLVFIAFCIIFTAVFEHFFWPS